MGMAFVIIDNLSNQLGLLIESSMDKDTEIVMHLTEWIDGFDVTSDDYLGNNCEIVGIL